MSASKSIAGVFEVGEQIQLAIDLALVNGVIPDVAILDDLVHGRPGMGVQIFVTRRFIRLEAGDPCVTFRRGVRGASGKENG